MRNQIEVNGVAISMPSGIKLQKKRTMTDVIANHLQSPKLMEALAPNYINGSPTGHKMLDAADSVEKVLAFDAVNGGVITALLDAKTAQKVDVVAALNDALRRYYTLNKAWKIVGYSKRVALTAAPTA